MHNDLHQHSECPTWHKHGSAVFHIRYQVVSVLAPFFGVLFERCEMSKLPSISWSFFTIEKLYFGGQNSVYLYFFSVHDFKQFLAAHSW